jgi:Fe-Mn family superoxide dismutase
MIYTFPELDYEYNALEPYIDAQTMEIHHSKHHKAYFDKFIKAIESSKLNEKPIEEVLSNIEKIPEEIKKSIINNGGGFYNHSIFWKLLSKNKPFNHESEIGKAILEKFQSYENFKEELTNSALTLFGSGWAWLVLNENKGLEIVQTKNQDSVISQNKIPLILIDVWEHAYYLKYQNKRPEYIENFFNIINWEKVNELFLEAKP